ncbi:two-component system, response regulator YesN [Paenibacillus algorifonticola]|uniref:Two-component system, response regulator YesN n=1 Tax=Paenibacillus algorifonticola TaxID=684063 RepID=A0A1I2I017_9BACL|nr:response regulator [Paenibacillus algorifonticola]SFF35624.1 two-component system, response regulator YesN [Paenibacillus algorifonticola]
MYKVLIVDDEPEIRLGLRLKVDWEELGLRIAGEAANGTEALEQLEREVFDVVITDMNMPVMDGLSFLDNCRKLYPEIRLIILTGYEDFNYAHAAVRHQARHYLLKPVARDELTEALLKVRQELDKEQESYRQSADMKWRLTQYYQEMKEHFLRHLIRGEAGREDTLVERARLFQLEEWGERTVRFMTAGLQALGQQPVRQEDTQPGQQTHQRTDQKTDRQTRQPEQFSLAFELICRELAEGFAGSLQAIRDEHYYGLMHVVLLDEEAESVEFEQKLRDIVSGHLGFKPSIGIGNAVKGFQQWREGCMSSLVAWNMAEAQIRQGERATAEPFLLPKETADLIRRLLERGEMEQLVKMLERELKEALSVSRIRFVKAIFQLNLILEAQAHEAHVPIIGGEQLWVRPEMALNFSTAEKACHYLMKLAAAIHDKLQGAEEDADYSVMEASRQYIEENYMYDLNLTMLSEKFNYNSSYFSELFKAKSGKTFIQYLTDVRMAHAIRLLRETGLSLWDISELTGFSNASYFSSKFKRIYGMNPSEFRQRHPEKSDNEFPKK